MGLPLKSKAASALLSARLLMIDERPAWAQLPTILHLGEMGSRSAERARYLFACTQSMAYVIRRNEFEVTMR